MRHGEVDERVDMRYWKCLALTLSHSNSKNRQRNSRAYLTIRAFCPKEPRIKSRKFSS
jgi:hypothetical protein